MATERDTQLESIECINHGFWILHIVGIKKKSRNHLTITRRSVFRLSTERSATKKPEINGVWNLIRKCRLSHSWEMSLLLSACLSPLESDGKINHWGIKFQSQLGRTGWIPSLWNGLGGELWAEVPLYLRSVPLACAGSSCWLDCPMPASIPNAFPDVMEELGRRWREGKRNGA
jgi:hypothetical protein